MINRKNTVLTREERDVLVLGGIHLKGKQQTRHQKGKDPERFLPECSSDFVFGYQPDVSFHVFLRLYLVLSAASTPFRFSGCP